MTDGKEGDGGGAAETPIQRALRLKKAAQGAKPGRPEDRLQRKETAGPTAGKSKPWMKR